MTVEELIENLQRLPKELPIYVEVRKNYETLQLYEDYIEKEISSIIRDMDIGIIVVDD